MQGHRRALGWLATILFMILTPLVAYAASNTGSGPQSSGRTAAFGTMQTYTVQPGDTLWSLAKKLRVSVSELVAWNNVTDPNFIQAGQTIEYESTENDEDGYADSASPGEAPSSGQSANSQGDESASAASDNADVTKVGTQISCTLTAYTDGPESTGKSPGDPGYGITSTGKPAVQGVTVAVDPRVIPYGTKLFIPGVGFRIAEDTGGAIVGDHIDIFFNDVSVARNFGVKHDVPVYVLPNWFPIPNFQF